MTIYHIGISGGKDSTALLLWAIHESGLPRESLRVTFSDTDNEHDWTYWYVRFLSRYVRRVTDGKVKIEWLRPELGFYDLARKKKRFPSQVARFCTEQLKLVPTQKHIDSLEDQGFNVIALSGVRNDESHGRSRIREHEPACNGLFNVPSWHPLIKWQIADVWAIHERYGVPCNPLYMPTQSVNGVTLVKGYACIKTPVGIRPYRGAAGRVGCYPCVNSRKAEVANVARNFPHRIDLIRNAEIAMEETGDSSSFFHCNTIPFRFRSKVSEAKAKAAKDTKAAKESLFAGDTISGVAQESEPIMVATIDDVVRWALSDADENETLDFEEEALAARLVCARSGACE